ncbi:nitrite/sulfite reductase [Derxia gummosa]|uniref:Nitrite/sulfite reductase n=1 Tax=Derxia gummosa DSM 723 TaxID=1121388 RepID=A0A8B6X252_9BURK|nr:nitrite/sulfite reductase [Derxia gummosa]
MYRYTEFDQQMVDERVAQFADQIARNLRGELADDELRPLRLQNGLYIQRHGPMLRVAIPYGVFAAYQLRGLANIARTYDRGWAHFSTRQNLQYNWFRFEDTPAMLADLAKVQMHAVQTSGNCVRNITTDAFAGVAPDEIVDPRPVAELLRQWSTFHPEFANLPRKFKIAISGTKDDRAAISVHDIGLQLRLEDGALVADVYVGGGLGRTPIIGSLIRKGLPWQHLITYIEAALRVYNLHGRRDNLYKARIKILVKALGAAKFAEEVEAEWQHLKDGPGTLPQSELDRIAADFTLPEYETLDDNFDVTNESVAFQRWAARSVKGHRQSGYRAVTISLKGRDLPPGDITADQMDAVAALADEFSASEIRATHEQNLVLPHVRAIDLPALYERLVAAGLATPNLGFITDIICCPGGDLCALANAKSIPIAKALQQRFDDLDYQHDIGDITLNISGCINSCGHHHIGHIGILGVDKHDEEWYQVTLGGDYGASPEQAHIGTIIGPSFAAEQVPDVVEKIVRHYLANREGEEERFIDAFRRIGIASFKQAAYATEEGAAHV